MSVLSLATRALPRMAGSRTGSQLPAVVLHVHPGPARARRRGDGELPQRSDDRPGRRAHRPGTPSRRHWAWPGWTSRCPTTPATTSTRRTISARRSRVSLPRPSTRCRWSGRWARRPAGLPRALGPRHHRGGRRSRDRPGRHHPGPRHAGPVTVTARAWDSAAALQPPTARARLESQRLRQQLLAQHRSEGDRGRERADAAPVTFRPRRVRMAARSGSP